MVIDGVTYTGTATNPIYVTYDPSDAFISIKQGSYSISWSEFTGGVVFPSGYSVCSIRVSASETPTVGNLSSVNLTSITSLGGSFTHDLIAKSHLTDTLGTSDARYKNVWAGTSYFPGLLLLTAGRVQGYSRLPNGLILQWGSATTSYNAIYGHTIDLDNPFPNTIEFFWVFPTDGAHNDDLNLASSTSKLRLGKLFEWRGTEIKSAYRVYFIALGT